MHLTFSVLTDNRSTSALLVPSFFSALGGIVFGLKFAAHIRVSSPAPASSTSTTATNQTNPSQTRRDETAERSTATTTATPTVRVEVDSDKADLISQSMILRADASG
jgi:transmembrane E3 ubiquitin-protein ligase